MRDATANIVLGRRSTQRVRRIEINGGEGVLDFSSEPGWTTLSGETIANQWRGARPLTRSLSSFFEVVVQSKVDSRIDSRWPLSVESCLDSVKFAEAIAAELKQHQEQRFQELRDAGVSLADSATRNLIVDLKLPEYSVARPVSPCVTRLPT